MAFSHSDLYLTITPTLGPRRGIDFPPDAVSKVSFDPGGKSSYMKGLAITPVAIVTGAAEPKLSLEISKAPEAWRISRHVGGLGGYPCTITCVYQRSGMVTVEWKFTNCKLETGGGFDSDDSAGVTSKMDFKLINAYLDGVSIYRKRAVQQ